ncbi:hypothetical protein C8R43DRAFT_945884 [Mycena crocata]|nr:hypothetical protein C8R43DRAFT_945884 [Mycena crocata]
MPRKLPNAVRRIALKRKDLQSIVLADSAHMYLCVLSALNPSEAGPISFTYNDPDEITALAKEMAEEIVSILGHDYPTQAILEDALQLSAADPHDWLKEYTGRKQYDCMEDNFYYTGVVIGKQAVENEFELRRVEGFSYDHEAWDTLVVDCGDGKVERRDALTRYGGRGAPFFCWERPYLYFRDWIRKSCPTTALWDDSTFAAQFYRVVDSDHGDCRHRRDISGPPPCISYGGMENTQEMDGFQENFCDARNGSVHTAAAIATGARGRDLWPALARDCGAWMATRPDLWPAKPESTTATSVHIDPPSGTATLLHTLPPEILLEILRRLALPALLSLLLLSRGISTLIAPLLDETLWHHVHDPDAVFRWVLPVAAVEGEVERAERVARGWWWSANPRRELRPNTKGGYITEGSVEAEKGPVSALSSKDFPFSQFLPACLESDSMRNRQRLWRVAQQYGALWETVGFDIQ